MRYLAVVAVGYLFAIVPCNQMPAQVAPPVVFSGESVYAHVNHQAVLSKAGDITATADLAHELFKSVAIPTEVADAFGFTDRIVRADVAYQQKTLPAVHESDIVKAINNIVSTIGGPQWARTNQVEVRKLRMHMLVLYPQLLASRERPDGNGHRKAVGDNLRPIEAAWIATTMLYQKAYNADYQFTETENAQNAKLSTSAMKAKRQERVDVLQAMLHGKTQSISVRDLVTASDRFFSDLGIQPSTLFGSVDTRSSGTKGGF